MADKLIMKKEFKSSEIVSVLGEHMTRNVKGKNACKLEAVGKYRVEVHFVAPIRANDKRTTVAIANLYILEEEAGAS